MHKHDPQFCVASCTSTGSILFKHYFPKSCNTYQLTNQFVCLFAKTYQILDLIGLHIAYFSTCFGPRAVTEDHNSEYARVHNCQSRNLNVHDTYGGRHGGIVACRLEEKVTLIQKSWYATLI